MHVRYDPEVDILYLRLSDAPIADSEAVEPNLVVDRDAYDNIVGVELLWVSRLAGGNPREMTFIVSEPAVTGDEIVETTEAAG